MSIRMTLAAVAAVFAASTMMTAGTAEAGFKRDRAAKAPAPVVKAAPAPRAHASCPLTAMMSRVHTRVHAVRAARPAPVVHVAPVRAERKSLFERFHRPARVAHAAPAPRAKPMKVAKAAPAPKK